MNHAVTLRGMASNAPADVYGIVYGMHRTTVYLPHELKERLAVEAKVRGITEAECVRRAVEQWLARPRPRGGLFAAGDIVERMDELMEGFGEP